MDVDFEKFSQGPLTQLSQNGTALVAAADCKLYIFRPM